MLCSRSGTSSRNGRMMDNTGCAAHAPVPSMPLIFPLKGVNDEGKSRKPFAPGGGKLPTYLPR